LLAAGLHGLPALCSARVAKAAQLLPDYSPASAGQHHAPADDPGQEGSIPQRAPIPEQSEGDALHLEKAEEAVDSMGAQKVVGVGQSGNHAPAQPRRAKKNLLPDYRDPKIRERDLPLRRHAGFSQVRNLVSSQHGASGDVAYMAFRLMHDLGEEG